MRRERIKMKTSSTEQTLPMVSIGMPVYNGAKYIRDALDSLLRQTFTDFELIISDNASSDQTEEICREYAEHDVRVIYFRQKENIGAALNFQFVLDHARANVFMWAAYDDEWTKNYLKSAKALLVDEKINFVFPTFSVRSIKLNVGKKFGREIFEFIEATDRRQRVLQFLALHHASHKCNIVYSLFKTEFLRSALNIQDISNDGVLGAVILRLSQGRVLDGFMFRKRYPELWPGAFSTFFAWYYKDRSKGFDVAKEAASNRLSEIFPEYVSEIKEIFSHYRPFSHGKSYWICSIENRENINESK